MHNISFNCREEKTIWIEKIFYLRNMIVNHEFLFNFSKLTEQTAAKQKIVYGHV